MTQPESTVSLPPDTESVKVSLEVQAKAGEQRLALVKIVATALIAVVLVVCMTWIVLNPNTTDESSKAALLVVGSAVGFMLGRETA